MTTSHLQFMTILTQWIAISRQRCWLIISHEKFHESFYSNYLTWLYSQDSSFHNLIIPCNFRELIHHIWTWSHITEILQKTKKGERNVEGIVLIFSCKNILLCFIGVHFDTSSDSLNNEISTAIKVFAHGVENFINDPRNANETLNTQLSCEEEGESRWRNGERFYK